MNEQPEALRLAEVFPYLEGGERSQWIMDAAAELRRLHEMNQELLEALREWKEFWDAECETGEKTVEKMLTAISKATREQA